MQNLWTLERIILYIYGSLKPMAKLPALAFCKAGAYNGRQKNEMLEGDYI